MHFVNYIYYITYIKLKRINIKSYKNYTKKYIKKFFIVINIIPNLYYIDIKINIIVMNKL